MVNTTPVVHAGEEMDQQTIITPVHFTSVNPKVDFVTHDSFEKLNTDLNSATELSSKKAKLHSE